MNNDEILVDLMEINSMLDYAQERLNALREQIRKEHEYAGMAKRKKNIHTRHRDGSLGGASGATDIHNP